MSNPLASLPHEHTVLLIDGSNTHAASRSLRFFLDFGKILSLVNTTGVFLTANYYASVVRNSYVPPQALYDWLSHNGYVVLCKTAVVERRFDKDKIKGSVTVEMATDMMHLAGSVPHSHIILFSGDDDLAYPVGKLRNTDCRVTVVSTVEHGIAGKALRNVASDFVDLSSIRDLVERFSEKREAS